MGDSHTTGPTDERTTWPGWIKALLQWLAIAIAVIGAVTALLAALGKLGDTSRSTCQALTLCQKPAAANSATSSAPAIAPKPVPPTIPNADSGWMGGGSSGHEYCEGVLKGIKQQYPDFTIEMTVLPEEHRSEYHPFKTDSYRYQCSFAAH